MEKAQAISEAKLAAKVGQVLQVIVDEVDDDGATCRTKADAPEIDGNLFIDEGFEGLGPGDIVTVTVEEAGEYDLWGRVAPERAGPYAAIRIFRRGAGDGGRCCAGRPRERRSADLRGTAGTSSMIE